VTTTKDNPYRDSGCPICHQHAVSSCRCSHHTLEDLKNGHGLKCPNGHRFSGDLVYDPSSPQEAPVKSWRKTTWMNRIAEEAPETTPSNDAPEDPLAVANEISRQIGPQAFLMMGTRHKAGNHDSLAFDVRGAKNGINKIIVRLNSKDLYDVEFWKIPGRQGFILGKPSEKVKANNDIYVEDLKGVIEAATGLYLSL